MPKPEPKSATMTRIPLAPDDLKRIDALAALTTETWKLHRRLRPDLYEDAPPGRPCSRATAVRIALAEALHNARAELEELRDRATRAEQLAAQAPEST